MKKIALSLIFVMTVCVAANAANAYIVNNAADAAPLINKAVAYVNDMGLRIRTGVQFHVVDAATLDSLCPGSVYKGVELGLYMYKNGGHHIYVMTGIDSDRFLATCAHEYAHAWQAENCPPGQDSVLREGFARWCEVKALEADGAYVLAQNYRLSNDPVYGRGCKLMLDREVKNGVSGVINFVKTTQSAE